jgi:hypothetical protein
VGFRGRGGGLWISYGGKLVKALLIFVEGDVS